MAVRELAAAGRIDPDEAWRRYAELDRWAMWAPLIAGVDCSAERLATGIRGTVRSVAGVGIAFEVEAVDEESRRWRWRVWVGPTGSPLQLSLDHEVLDRPGGGTVATLRLDGPWPLITAYAPASQLALARLVRP